MEVDGWQLTPTNLLGSSNHGAFAKGAAAGEEKPTPEALTLFALAHHYQVDYPRLKGTRKAR